jgi:ribonuclease R
MDFLKGLGINRKWHADNVYPKDFQALLGELAESESPLAPLVNRVMLRSMQKAKYSPENEGHFGLASKCYSHFTSPIRRYPDLAIHRVLKAFFRGEQDIEERYLEFVASASTQSGNKERGAETAERAVDDYYKMLYMSDHVGEEFTGVISGVQNFGIFVELPSTVEGIVKVDTILGKDFKYDELNYTLSNKNRSFKLGQIVEIVVVGVDMGNKRAEFMLKDDYLNCKK